MRNSYLQSLSFELNINMKFGKGKIADLGPFLKEKGWERILIATDSGLLKSGILQPILDQLSEMNIRTDIFDQVEPNPKDTTIENATKMAIHHQAQAIVGIGGGSSMDTAKAAAMLVTNKGNVQDYDGTNKVKVDPLPIIAIPTTAGTGSEVTANAAITDSKNKYKMSIRSSKMIPVLSILDPDLLRTMPSFICATSSVDALTHAVEGYLSNRATTFTDLVALSSIEIISANIRPFYADPSQTDAAANMLYGSMLAGIVITNTGTGNAHALARALGGEFDVAHGHACAMFLPPVLRFNAIARPQKYVNLAKAMGLISEDAYITPEVAAEQVVQAIENLLDDLRIPKYLKDLSIPLESFSALAEIALSNSGPNPRKSTKMDMMKMLEETYSPQ